MFTSLIDTWPHDTWPLFVGHWLRDYQCKRLERNQACVHQTSVLGCLASFERYEGRAEDSSPMAMGCLIVEESESERGESIG